MERGLYIAASGMLSEMQRQDLIANDLANAATPGYKADRTAQHSFDRDPARQQQDRRDDRRARHRRQHRQPRSPTSPARAARKDTGEPLDFAIAGEGFFGVQTADGVRYTRNGRFTPTARAA